MFQDEEGGVEAYIAQPPADIKPMECSTSQHRAPRKYVESPLLIGGKKFAANSADSASSGLKTCAADICK